MTNKEIIDIICKIKSNPEGHDFSSYLYSAVGLIKQQKDAGTVHLIWRLADTIEEASGGNLSDFCKKRIEIIRKEGIKPMSKLLEKMAYTIEYSEYIKSVPEEFR